MTGTETSEELIFNRQWLISKTCKRFFSNDPSITLGHSMNSRSVDNPNLGQDFWRSESEVMGQCRILAKVGRSTLFLHKIITIWYYSKFKEKVLTLIFKIKILKWKIDLKHSSINLFFRFWKSADHRKNAPHFTYFQIARYDLHTVTYSKTYTILSWQDF